MTVGGQEGRELSSLRPQGEEHEAVLLIHTFLK